MLFALEEPQRLTKEQAEWEEKQRIRGEWELRRATVDGYLQEAFQRGPLAAFRHRMEPFFEAMRERANEPYKRRPNISLRLICAGDPPAKVIVLPLLRGRHKELHLVCSEQHLELLEEREVITREGPAKKFSQMLTVKLRPDCATSGTISVTVYDEVRRLVATIADFMDNPAAVLARSHDRCCICGRGLTDELSRSRGIGPECIKKVDMFAFFTKDSLVQPEQAEMEAFS